MSYIVNLINMMNQLANNNNVLNRSFNDQGGSSKPCSASFVDSLEKVVVTNEDVDKGLCCAICQEDFKMGERVIRLPCKDPHYFHCATPEDICGGILPWLNNNNSCPVCREEFPEEEEDIPVPRENSSRHTGQLLLFFNHGKKIIIVVLYVVKNFLKKKKIYLFLEKILIIHL